MDHYLAKTLVLNLLTLRFANRELGHLFHCHHVANVRITFKEAIGVEGRASVSVKGLRVSWLYLSIFSMDFKSLNTWNHSESAIKAGHTT